MLHACAGSSQKLSEPIANRGFNMNVAALCEKTTSFVRPFCSIVRGQKCQFFHATLISACRLSESNFLTLQLRPYPWLSGTRKVNRLRHTASFFHLPSGLPSLSLFPSVWAGVSYPIMSRHSPPNRTSAHCIRTVPMERMPLTTSSLEKQPEDLSSQGDLQRTTTKDARRRSKSSWLDSIYNRIYAEIDDCKINNTARCTVQ